MYTRTVCRTDRLYLTHFPVLHGQKTIISSQREGTTDSPIFHIATLHLATDTVSSEELANPGFGMETDFRGPFPLLNTYPNT